MSVVGADTQQAVAVDVDRWVALATGALEAEGVAGDAELGLTFVDESRIAELNEAHLGEPGPTDVLAFPIDAADDPGPTLLGDVVVCPAVAVRQANGPVDDELALLVVHGVLHVLGHDHAEPDETARMQRREQELLERFHRKP